MITGIDRNFSILARGNDIFAISHTGIITQKVAVTPTVHIVLLLDTEVLDKVEVLGYGKQSKSTSGNSPPACQSLVVTIDW